MACDYALWRGFLHGLHGAHRTPAPNGALARADGHPPYRHEWSPSDRRAYALALAGARLYALARNRPPPGAGYPQARTEKSSAGVRALPRKNCEISARPTPRRKITSRGES